MLNNLFDNIHEKLWCENNYANIVVLFWSIEKGQ